MPLSIMVRFAPRRFLSAGSELCAALSVDVISAASNSRASLKPKAPIAMSDMPTAISAHDANALSKLAPAEAFDKRPAI